MTFKVLGEGGGGSSALVSTAKVQLETTAVSPYTFVTTTLSGRWSDNGLLLVPFEPAVIEFAGWHNFSAAQLAATLTIQTVRGTFV